MSDLDLRVAVGGLYLANPVMVASGTFGFGREYSRLGESMNVGALGAVVTKGLSIEPRAGNQPPRTVETASGMLNSVGLENPGFEKFVEDKLPWLRTIPAKVVVNMFGSTTEEYARLARWHVDHLGIDTLTVRYEELLAHPRRVTADLAAFIGVSDKRLIRRAAADVGKRKAHFRLTARRITRRMARLGRGVLGLR